MHSHRLYNDLSFLGHWIMQGFRAYLSCLQQRFYNAFIT